MENIEKNAEEEVTCGTEEELINSLGIDAKLKVVFGGKGQISLIESLINLKSFKAMEPEP